MLTLLLWVVRSVSTMITDGLSAIGSEMEVKDIAEIVWEQIKANDAAIEAKKAEPTEA